MLRILPKIKTYRSSFYLFVFSSHIGPNTHEAIFKQHSIYISGAHSNNSRTGSITWQVFKMSNHLQKNRHANHQRQWQQHMEIKTNKFRCRAENCLAFRLSFRDYKHLFSRLQQESHISGHKTQKTVKRQNKLIQNSYY